MARDKHKTYFTLRERIAREHWMFSRVHSKRHVTGMRKRMWTAMPFQLDEHLTGEYLGSSYALQEGHVRNPTSHASVSIPHEYNEIEHWRMPASLMWVETVAVKHPNGNTIPPIGALYYSAVDHFSANPRGYEGKRPKHLLTKMGAIFTFVPRPDGDGWITCFGVFANGFEAIDQLSGGAHLRAPSPGRRLFPAIMMGDYCESFADVTAAYKRFAGQSVVPGQPGWKRLRVGRDMMVELWYPFLKIFNAVPTKAFYRQYRDYNPPADEFLGSTFTTLGNKHVEIATHMDKMIRLKFDVEVVHSTGRRKALEFVRGFWRTRKKGKLLPREKWKWVDAFERGDPSLGVSQRSYEYVSGEKDEKAYGNSKRDPSGGSAFPAVGTGNFLSGDAFPQADIGPDEDLVPRPDKRS